MADWIWMLFEMVGQLGPRMRQVVGIGDCFVWDYPDDPVPER